MCVRLSWLWDCYWLGWVGWVVSCCYLLSVNNIKKDQYIYCYLKSPVSTGQVCITNNVIQRLVFCCSHQQPVLCERGQDRPEGCDDALQLSANHCQANTTHLKLRSDQNRGPVLSCNWVGVIVQKWQLSHYLPLFVSCAEYARWWVEQFVSFIPVKSHNCAGSCERHCDRELLSTVTISRNTERKYRYQNTTLPTCLSRVTGIVVWCVFIKYDLDAVLLIEATAAFIVVLEVSGLVGDSLSVLVTHLVLLCGGASSSSVPASFTFFNIYLGHVGCCLGCPACHVCSRMRWWGNPQSWAPDNQGHGNVCECQQPTSLGWVSHITSQEWRGVWGLCWTCLVPCCLVSPSLRPEGKCLVDSWL